ncbi:MAG: hypothetical protein O7C75_15510 [Verrucomicrobia bacterium]|nr:hypothetical protein [Verrucomicrobiota bacterium]
MNQESESRVVPEKPTPNYKGNGVLSPYIWKCGYLLILVLFILNIIRAYTQSITHDEAITYIRFVSRGWEYVLGHFSSNNHTFHSTLVKLSTATFGLSHLSIRIPALLGGFLYMMSVERLCRNFCKGNFEYFLSLAALTTSPFILDYLVVARGYSLALGFFMLAFLIAALELLTDDSKEKGSPKSRTYMKISCLCSLSVASNLSFAFVNVSLLLVFFSWSYLIEDPMRGKRNFKNVSQSIAPLLLPGAILYMFLNPSIVFAKKSLIYYGSQSWSSVYNSLVTATFDDFGRNDVWISWPEFVSGIFTFLPFLLAICILYNAAIALRSLKGNDPKKPDNDGRLKLWKFVFLILCVAFTTHSFAFYFLGVLLPKERTGIFFVPLFLLLGCISLGDFRRVIFSVIFEYLSRISLTLVVLCFITSLRMNYFREWKYDSGSEEVFLELKTLSDDGFEFGIGINWLFEPALNFYRIYFTDSTLPEFTWNPIDKRQKYFVLLPDSFDEDNQFLENKDIEVVYRHPVSAAVICVRK